MNGVFYADPVMLKSTIFPRRADITIEQVEGYLCEMEAQGLLYRYEAGGDVWQCWPGFADNQPNLRRDREKPEYPPPPEEPPQQDALLAGKMTAECRQDDGKNPAEVKLSEVKLSEDNAPPRSAAPSSAAEVQAAYPELELKAPQYAELDRMIEQRITSQPHLIAAMRWARQKGITDLPAIAKAAIGWRDNGSSPDPPPPRPPPSVIDIPTTPPAWLTGESADG